jgi:hypothetical protein
MGFHRVSDEIKKSVDHPVAIKRLVWYQRESLTK